MDGKDVDNTFREYLDYLSELCKQLDVPDPVEEYFAPVVGRWSALHAEAERWRTAGKAADEVSSSLTSPLGALDAAWQGDTADSFIAYMQDVGLAGNDMSDAMTAMGDVLDKTADGIRSIVVELAGVLADTAEASSQSMASPLGGAERTRAHLATVQRPTREFFESVRQVLEAFVQLCDGIDGTKAFAKVTMAHTMPAANWTAGIDIPTPAPSPKPAPAPAPEPVTGSSASGGSGSSGSGSGGSGSGSSGGAAASTPAPKPLAPGANTAVGEVLPTPPPGATPATPTAAPAAAAAAGGMGGGMMMPPMMGAGTGGGSQDHNSKSRLITDPDEIFGTSDKGSPSVIGEDD
jgi:uncharacterized protein YukE